MLSPPPEEEPQANNKIVHKNRNKKRKKKSGRKNQHGVAKNKRKNGKLAQTMSAWAENFTFAATWQLKHQLAYWKARAKALEYENGILHEIIRKKNYVGPIPESSIRVDSEPSTQFESDNEEDEETTEEYDGDENLELSDENFEVSEEYIQFLQANAKYKEDARLERERLRAKENSAVQEMEAGPSEPQENYDEVHKNLYGDKWQRISALEMSLHSQFICESDKDKPMHWPNIPFNFNFG